MRKTLTATSTVLLTSLLVSFSALPSLAQQNNRARNHKHTISPNQFPGVGSYESWKASEPEIQAGTAMMKDHKWDEAIAHFRAALALYEFQPHAWLEIGKAIEKKDGNIQEAETAYRQSLKLNSQSWQAWHRLANILYIQKRYAEAREAVSNALNLNPPAEARTNMGKLVVMIDSGQRDANTTELNQSQ